MQLSEHGAGFIRSFEGCRLKAYQDSVKVWTIGYGTTRIDGKPVQPGMVITQLEAERLFLVDAEKFVAAVNESLRVTVTQHQFDALVSLAYNIGSGAFMKSTLLRLLNDGKATEAALQFLRWNKAGGKELRGLTRRRQAEKALFEKV